ncbi:putative Single minded, partial [Danaus plexippus plexippus]
MECLRAKVATDSHAQGQVGGKWTDSGRALTRLTRGF